MFDRLLCIPLLAAPALAQGTVQPTWTRSTGHVASASSSGYGAVADPLGGVLVCGGTGTSNPDLFVGSYDDQGAPRWTYQLATNSTERLYDCAFDPSGRTFAVGTTSGTLVGPNQFDLWPDPLVVCLDANGSLLWMLQPDTSYIGFYTAVELDGSGGVFVGGGNAPDFPHTTYETWVRRYDGDGQLLWSHSAALEGIVDLAPTSDGGVFSVTNRETYMEPSMYEQFVEVRRFDSQGVLLWTRTLGSPSTQARACESDGAGGLLVAGLTWGTFGGSQLGGDDAFIVRIDPTGDIAWTRRFGTIEDDEVQTLATDATHALYFHGRTRSAGLFDAFAGRVGPDGDFAWWSIDTSGLASGHSSALVSDGAGALYVWTEDRGVPGNDFTLTRYDVRPGRAFCDHGTVNSTGALARLRFDGSPVLGDSSASLLAWSLPAASASVFLVSDVATAMPAPSGRGQLCLGGAVGGPADPSWIRAVDPAGTTSIPVDLTRLPRPGGSISAMAGETWCFQVWFRDVGVGGGSSSNLSDAVSVTIE